MKAKKDKTLSIRSATQLERRDEYEKQLKANKRDEALTFTIGLVIPAMAGISYFTGSLSGLNSPSGFLAISTFSVMSILASLQATDLSKFKIAMEHRKLMRINKIDERMGELRGKESK